MRLAGRAFLKGCFVCLLPFVCFILGFLFLFVFAGGFCCWLLFCFHSRFVVPFSFVCLFVCFVLGFIFYIYFSLFFGGRGGWGGGEGCRWGPII